MEEKYSEKELEIFQEVYLLEPVYPRKLECHPPVGMTGKDVRIAIQALVSQGKLIVDDNLKLITWQHGFFRFSWSPPY